MKDSKPWLLIGCWGRHCVKSKVMVAVDWVRARQGYSHRGCGSASRDSRKSRERWGDIRIYLDTDVTVVISRSQWASNLYQKLIKVVSHGSFVDPLLFVIYFYYIISSSQIGMYIYMQMTQYFTVLLILHWNLPNHSLVTNCFAFIMFSVQFLKAEVQQFEMIQQACAHESPLSGSN